jgi:demethylspheroidene O-methyltransferase
MRIETVDDVQDFLGAPALSAALAAALELGLFWTLEGGPRSSVSIADEYAIPDARCRAWLLVLVSLGLLEENDEGFDLSPTGRSAVLGGASRDSWRYLAQEAREAYPLGTDLVHRLGRQGAVTEDPDAITDYVDRLRADPERARRFTELLYDLHGWLGQAVADTVDLRRARRLLDVGGGSGVVALALLGRFPALTAVVADIPPVCAAGRVIADRTELAARIDYRPIELSVDDLPNGFDVIMTCDAGFDTGLLPRISDALREGGRYLLVDRWIDTGRTQRATIAPELFQRSLADLGVRVPSVEHVYEDLRAVGLEPAPYVELARPRWKMVEAHKVG